MIKTKSIDHVCLWVRSLAESRDYYEKVFGASCIPRENDNTTLAVAAENVHFFLSKNRGDDEFLSKQHLSFEVESLD